MGNYGGRIPEGNQNPYQNVGKVKKIRYDYKNLYQGLIVENSRLKYHEQGYLIKIANQRNDIDNINRELKHYRVLSDVQKETCERWMKEAMGKDKEINEYKARIKALETQLRG